MSQSSYQQSGKKNKLRMLEAVFKERVRQKRAWKKTGLGTTSGAYAEDIVVQCRLLAKVYVAVATNEIPDDLFEGVFRMSVLFSCLFGN